MRRAFGKSYGKACRINIGDHLVSIRVKKEAIPHVLEALRRGKLPGRQNVFISVNHGFSNYTHAEIEETQKNEKLVAHGNHAVVEGNRGPLEKTLLFKRFNKLVREKDDNESQ